MVVDLASKNPNRVRAGRQNQLKRGPWTAEQRERARQSALRHQPWRHSTGPKTVAGKLRSAANGRVRQEGPRSIRQLRADVADVDSLTALMAQLRRATPR